MLSYAMKADSAGKSQTRLFTRTLLEKVSSHSLIEHFVALTRQLDLRHTKDGISSLLDPKESKLLKKRRCGARRSLGSNGFVMVIEIRDFITCQLWSEGTKTVW